MSAAYAVLIPKHTKEKIAMVLNWYRFTICTVFHQCSICWAWLLKSLSQSSSIRTAVPWKFILLFQLVPTSACKYQHVFKMRLSFFTGFLSWIWVPAIAKLLHTKSYFCSFCAHFVWLSLIEAVVGLNEDRERERKRREEKKSRHPEDTNPWTLDHEACTLPLCSKSERGLESKASNLFKKEFYFATVRYFLGTTNNSDINKFLNLESRDDSMLNFYFDSRDCSVEKHKLV